MGGEGRGSRAGKGDKRPGEGLVLAPVLSWKGNGGTERPPFFQGMVVIRAIINGALGERLSEEALSSLRAFAHVVLTTPREGCSLRSQMRFVKGPKVTWESGEGGATNLGASSEPTLLTPSFS